MTVDTYTAFTIWDWSDDSRPEVRIDLSGKPSIGLYVGDHLVSTVEGDSKTDLKDQLEGYAEIFAEAAKSLGE